MERITKQGTAILEVIRTAGRPLLPQEIFDLSCLRVPGIGIATVYRNINSLLDRGAIQEVHLPGENPRYEISETDHEHHHHFQCYECEKVFDVHACPGDFSHLAPKGFKVHDHELTLYGSCSDCHSIRDKK
jgi:Fur family transcriptional regulator, ferric uptake regulator